MTVDELRDKVREALYLIGSADSLTEADLPADVKFRCDMSLAYDGHRLHQGSVDAMRAAQRERGFKILREVANAEG